MDEGEIEDSYQAPVNEIHEVRHRLAARLLPGPPFHDQIVDGSQFDIIELRHGVSFLRGANTPARTSLAATMERRRISSITPSG
jgi:hypothetical protein